VSLPSPNWDAVWRLWPLLLIFGGVNIIVRQVRRPIGTLLSGLVTVSALGLFGFVLFGGAPSLARSVEARTELVTVPVGEAQEALVSIDFSSAGGELFAGDPGTLIDGTISLVDDVIVGQEMDGDRAVVTVDTRSRGFFWFLDGVNLDPWQIGLSPALPIELRLDLSSGYVDLDLAELELSGLEVDASSAAFETALPAGSYPASFDLSSGSSTLTLAEGSTLNLEIDGGSGSVRLVIPNNLPTRVTVDGGSGAFRHDDRFELVSGDRDDGVWQTTGFDTFSQVLEIDLRIGSGSVSIQLP
jgi:hypothetical protein